MTILPTRAATTLHALLSTGLVAGLAVATGAPLLFPALGASAVIVFGAPTAPTSRPRNVVCSHLLGAVVGWCMLAAFGVAAERGGLSAPLDAAHATTGVLSLGLTTWLMLRLAIFHPAAGATTMIVGMGLLPQAHQIVSIVAAAALLCLYARIVLRRARIAYPWWT